MNGYELINTVHSWVQSLPISENNLECLKCACKVSINDLGADSEKVCGLNMTRKEREQIIKNGNFSGVERNLLRTWFGEI